MVKITEPFQPPEPNKPPAQPGSEPNKPPVRTGNPGPTGPNQPGWDPNRQGQPGPNQPGWDPNKGSPPGQPNQPNHQPGWNDPNRTDAQHREGPASRSQDYDPNRTAAGGPRAATDDLHLDVQRLNEELTELQRCPGNLNAEQQTLLTAVQGKAKGIAEKLKSA